MGRHTEYTAALGDEVCAWIAEGNSLLSWCKANDARYGTIMSYLSSQPTFADNYARAREDQAHKLAEEIIQIADDGLNDSYEDENGNKRTDQDVIARSRLRVDARKWYAGKLSPKKYGDYIRNDTALSGAVDVRSVSMTDEQLAAIAVAHRT